jgi:hypothetical protein
MDTTAASDTKLYRSSDWHRLTGRFVEVRRGEQLYRRGIVDSVMPDGSGVWLAADATYSRKYVAKADGYVLWSDHFYF